MEITFKVEGNKQDTDMTISNDDLNNLNYVSLCIEDKEYLVPVDDLHSAVEVFNKIRVDNKEHYGK